MKRKRRGAGERGSSDPFLTAKDLLKPCVLGKEIENGDFCSDSIGSRKETDTAPAATSSIRARANAVAASLNSPSKAGRVVSKRQQKLAEAAKGSLNISQFFVKKQTEKSQDVMPTLKELDTTSSTGVMPLENISEEQQSPVAVEGNSPDVMLGQCKTDVIIIPNEDESSKMETLGLVCDLDASKVDMKSSTE